MKTVSITRYIEDMDGSVLKIHKQEMSRIRPYMLEVLEDYKKLGLTEIQEVESLDKIVFEIYEQATLVKED